MTTSELRERTARLQEMIGLRQEPLALLFSDTEPDGYRPSGEKWSCVIGTLARARRGETVYFDADHMGCPGGACYLGFTPPSPMVPHLVSTGIPGKVPAERYKKSPETVKAWLDANPSPSAPTRFVVFKPVTALADDETAEVIICYASPDELAGLHFLAGFARSEDAVVTPFGSACGTIVARPLVEGERDEPRAVLGMFDPSGRPFVKADELTFAAPTALWVEMLGNADESYLTTETWETLRKRIGRGE